MRRPLCIQILLVTMIALGAVRVSGMLGQALSPPLGAVPGECPPVQNTPRFTIVYGTLTVMGAPGEVGSVVEARSPRGDTVGCFKVHTAGHYGAMFVYGEDNSPYPLIPGMRSGELVTFYADGVQAAASPPLVWHDDKEPHELSLSAGPALTPTDTLTPVPTHTRTPTPTDTLTPTPTNTLTPGPNHPPTNGAITPSTGSGPIGVTTYFTTTWHDANGWEDLKHGYFHVAASPSIVGSVTLLYNAAKDKLWIRSDDGSTWTGGCTPSEAGSIENSQAIVHCDEAAVNGSADTLSVTWAIEFKPGNTGPKKTGLKCRDRSKAKAKGQWIGAWTVD